VSYKIARGIELTPEESARELLRGILEPEGNVKKDRNRKND